MALFALYIVLITLLPAGTVLGINVKLLTFLPLGVAAIFLSLQKNDAIVELIGVTAVITALLLWTILSQFYAIYPLDLALSQSKDVMTTLAGCWFIRLFTPTDADRKAFVKLCIYVVSFGSLLKVLLVLYCLATGASVADITDVISSFFGVKLVSADLGGAGGRLQLGSDTLLPVCIFAVLCLRRALKMGEP